MRGFLADAGAGADDDDHLAGKFLLGGHALELRLLQEPVLDVKGLLLRERDVAVDRLRAAHHLDRAVVEFGGDPRLRLVLAPGDHAQARDQDHSRVRIAHRGRVGVLAGRVVRGVVLAVRLEPRGELGLEGGDVLLLGVPVNVEGLDLGPQEMVGAGGSQFGQSGGVLGIDEPEDLLVVLHRADEALLDGDLAPEPGQDRRERCLPRFRGERLVTRAAEGRGVAAFLRVLLLDVGGGLLDEVEGLRVALEVVVSPRDEPVLAHHDGAHLGVLPLDFLHGQSQLEARAHPRHVRHLSPEDFLGEGLAAGTRGDRDDRVGVHVVDVLARQEAVERGVDRRRPRIEVEGRVGVHPDHVVLRGGLEPLVGARGIERLEVDELLLVEGREVLARARTQVAAGALDPEDLDGFARQGVLFHDLGGGVAAARVGDALVAPQKVGAVDQVADGIE